MKHALFILLFVLNHLLFVSCQKDNIALEEALITSGNNRKELEKVLQYYSHDPADKFKYKAAVFLIENMPYYYSCEGAAIDTFKNVFFRITQEGIVGKQALDSVERKYGKLNYNTLSKIYDIHVINSEYLISNIEHSFMVWKKQPWGKHVSFDNFCNFILPYRIQDEPLEQWKPVYYQKFQPVLDSLLKTNSILDACLLLYNHITTEPWYFIMEMPPPHLGANYLLEQRSGSCRDRCDLAMYVMRSLGIPVGVDMVLHSPDQANRHFWNFVLDEQGITIEFTLWEEEPEKNLNTEIEKKRGKVYRKYFGVREKCLNHRKHTNNIPQAFQSLFIEDVSSNYIEDNKIYFSKNEIKKNDQKIHYLSVFDISGWFPVDWVEIHHGTVIFRNIEQGIVYTLTGQNDYTIPIYYPFILDKDNKKHYFIPDTNNTQTLKLDRKFTMKFMKPHMKRFTGGFFETSNSIDFSNSKTLYVIDSISTPKYYEHEISSPDYYRYIRYFSPDNSLCNMAELMFYDENELELKGKIIGTDGAWNNEKLLMKQAVFDKDPLTFFNAAESQGVWVGLDFGKPKLIKKIKYLPRNDDNFIREGDLYELYYWDNDWWVSLGKQYGTNSQILIYENAPSNALFWLRNHTRGKEERIFTYENGKQVWW